MKNWKVNSKIVLFLAIVSMLLTGLSGVFSIVEADDTNTERGIRDFDGILDITEGDRSNRGIIQDYLMHDHFPGDWCDAEKTVEDEEDDLHCWAAAASNVLEWTGWGLNVEPHIVDCDTIFQEFQDHWIDTGGFEHNGWHWWFDGAAPAGDVDVGGGGNYYPTLNWSHYFHQTWYDNRTTWDGHPSDSYDIMEALDVYLHQGWGVTLGFSSHAITAWGFAYNTSVDPGNFDEYYVGIWVTDSDDNKTDDPDPTPGVNNSSDEYPDTLRYYDLSYTVGRWRVLNYYGTSAAIDSFFAFEPMPNFPPTADANGPYTGFEGAAVTLDGTSSSDPDGDPLTYDWDLDYDGLYDDATGPTPSYTWYDNGLFTIGLKVSDGMDDDTTTAVVEIHNVAPSVTAGSDTTADEGESISFSGSFTDPGADTWTIEWDFGDGTTTIGTLTPTHAFGDDGEYTVTLTVTDDDGGTDSDTLEVTVLNVAPELVDLGPFTINENTALPISAICTDAGSDDLTFTWVFEDGPTTTTIYYNDGISPDTYPSPWGTFPFTVTDPVSHTYGDDGTFDLTLTVTDDDGGVVVLSTTVTVENVAPEIGPFGPFTVDENTPITFNGHATDPGSDDLTFNWSWGYYVPNTVTIYYNNGMSPDPYPSPDINPMDVTDVNVHNYGDNGVFIVTLTVTDDDGGAAVYSTTVTVNNVVPTLTDITLVYPYPDNMEFILPRVHNLEFYATATDQGSDDLTFHWDWDDNTSDTTTYYNNMMSPDLYPSPEVNTITVTDTQYHTYDEPGTYIVTLTVTDDDGGINTKTYEVIVLEIEDAKHDINDYIQGLPDDLFKGNANNRKNAFDNMFDALDDMLEDGEYWGMIQHLNNNIREKCDGYIDGKKGNDWIKGDTTEGYNAQWHICNKIDDLTAYLATLL